MIKYLLDSSRVSHHGLGEHKAILVFFGPWSGVRAEGLAAGQLPTIRKDFYHGGFFIDKQSEWDETPTLNTPWIWKDSTHKFLPVPVNPSNVLA